VTTCVPPSPAGRRSGNRRGVVLGAFGALVTFAVPGLFTAPASAAPAPPSVVAYGDASAPAGRAFAALRAASRPGFLALEAAHRAPVAAWRSGPIIGSSTTYFALQPAEFGAAQAIRFRTDGHAHVSKRDVIVPSSSDTVVVPTSAMGWNLVAMEVGYAGQNVVTVDGRAGTHRLTSDGHSSFGMLTPSRRVVFVTNDDNGAADGLAEVDLYGRGRRTIFHETDRNAVLSLPALSPSGRTAYLVRNTFDRRGLPQSSLLTVDVRTGHVSSRSLPGINYVTSVAASGNGRDLAFVGYRFSDNLYGKWLGFRAEADVLPVVGGTSRRVSWVDQPSLVFSRGGSRLIVGTGGRLVSVGVSSTARDQLYGTEGLSLPVLVR
jgi:hypothetical protein